ncbi:MAG: universal stress protein [Polyangiales bacterium]
MTDTNATASPKPRAAIVVGIDFGDASSHALLVALESALERCDGGREVHVHLVHTLALPSDAGMPLVATMPGMIDETRANLLNLADETTKRVVDGRDGRAPKGLHVITHISYGDAAREIVDVAERYTADLIVVGTHGRRGLSHLIMGSVAETVVRLAHTPVLVVRAIGKEPRSLIEPLCADCAKVRKESENKTWWCAQHSQHHPRPHGSAYSGASYDSAQPWGFEHD